MTGDDATRGWVRDQYMQPPRLFSVIVEGAKITCRGWNLDAIDLPGIVLVHGYVAHAAWWDHIGPALAADGYRVIALDFSGMGDSDRRDHYSRALHAREILATADAAHMPRPIVIAHSYGAVVSLIAAKADPDHFERLIILDSALPTAEEARRTIPDLPSRAYPDRQTAISRFRLSPPGGWPQPDVVQHIAEHSVTQMADGTWSWKFDSQMADTLNEESYRPAMLGVTVPCDLIYGEDTEIFNPARRAGARAIMHDCGRFIVLPAAHHHLMIEQPLALVGALRSLLANPKGAGATQS